MSDTVISSCSNKLPCAYSMIAFKSQSSSSSSCVCVATTRSSEETIIFSMISRRFSSESITSKRSEEHTSELQSRFDLVCRLLLEKKKIHTKPNQMRHHI